MDTGQGLDENPGLFHPCLVEAPRNIGSLTRTAVPRPLQALAHSVARTATGRLTVPTPQGRATSLPTERLESSNLSMLSLPGLAAED